MVAIDLKLKQFHGFKIQFYRSKNWLNYVKTRHQSYGATLKLAPANADQTTIRFRQTGSNQRPNEHSRSRSSFSSFTLKTQ